MRFSDENSVCLSLCLSVCQTRGLWQNGKNLSRFLYHTKDHLACIYIFWEEEWLVGAILSTWNFGSIGSRCSEIANFVPIFACSASIVTPSEGSSINNNRKSTARFPVSLRWSSYVARVSPPKRDHKRKTAVFGVKSHFA